MTEPPAEAVASPDPTSMLTSKAFLVLLLLAAVVGVVVPASATFAALTLIFASPLVSAVILIEAAGLSCRRLPLVLVPGLLAAGSGRSARSARDRGRAELERLRARRGPLGAGTAIRSSPAAASSAPHEASTSASPKLTTVGYRNPTARTDLKRTPALIEALLGQLYLVMGASGGVANLVPRRRLEGGNSQ